MAIALESSSARADRSVAVECATRQDVSIVSNGLSLEVRGQCATITVAGRSNLVTIASVTTLVVTGNRNTVLAGPSDRIDVRGDENMVKTSNRDAVVHNSGANNNIYLGTHRPRIVMQLQ